MTNNWRMLNIEHEMTAIVETKATVLATKGMGADAIRPAGALVLELPGLEARINHHRANIFLLTYQHRQAVSGWEFLKMIAARQVCQPITYGVSTALQQARC